MARAGLTRVDIKRARDSLIAQGMHASIDAIRIALGNTGSKTTIHRYLKELEEEEGASLTRAASLSDAIQDLVARLAARLHEEAQVRVDQQAAAAAAQRQQAHAEIAKLTGEPRRAAGATGQRDRRALERTGCARRYALGGAATCDRHRATLAAGA